MLQRISQSSYGIDNKQKLKTILKNIPEPSNFQKQVYKNIPFEGLKMSRLYNNPISFGSVRDEGFDNNILIDSGFGRGLDTMFAEKEILLETYPKGTNILISAGSTGEEAYTLGMLLNNPNFKLISLDSDPKAVSLGQKYEHCIFGHDWPDHFLIEDPSLLDERQKYFRSLFFEFFSPIEKPDDAKYSDAQYFRANDNAKKLIEFRKHVYGDIFKIDEFEIGRPVGAINFRNGMYLYTKNPSLNTILYDRPFLPANEVLLNCSVLDEIADKVYSRLDDNGIFVIGNAAQEHMFIAPMDMPNDKTIEIFLETSLARKNIKFMKKSPLEFAFEKNHKFEPIFWESLERLNNMRLTPDLKVPTIWRKLPKI